MNPLRFGLVKQVQFTDTTGKPLPASARNCTLAHNLDTQGSLSKPAFGVFSLNGVCGDPDNTFYLAYNGPHDTDGDTFKQAAREINTKYAQQARLDGTARANLIAEKTGLFQDYLAKLSGVLAVKVTSDNEFEF